MSREVPEITRLRAVAWGDHQDRVWVGDAEQAVRDALDRQAREIVEVLRSWADVHVPVPLGSVAVSLPRDVYLAAADEIESRFVALTRESATVGVGRGGSAAASGQHDLPRP